jgi:photosystem II stability/assembly factor-like uncharacterized protein
MKNLVSFLTVVFCMNIYLNAQTCNFDPRSDAVIAKGGSFQSKANTSRIRTVSDYFQHTRGFSSFGTCFLNDSIGFVADAGSALETYQHPRVMKTVDGGYTWSIDTNFNFTGEYPYELHYFSKTNAILTLSNGHVYRKYGGSNTWTRQIMNVNNMPNSFLYFDSLKWIAINHNNVYAWNNFFYTSNGGNSWTSQPIPLNQFNSYTYQFHIVGQDSLVTFQQYLDTIGKSFDGGHTWTFYPSNIGSISVLNCFYKINSKKWFISAAGLDALYKTEDAGITWTSCNLVLDIWEHISDISFVNNSTGYAFTYNYKKNYETTDGGNSWHLFKDLSSCSNGGAINAVAETPDKSIVYFLTTCQYVGCIANPNSFQYSWSPASNISNPTAAEPVLFPQITTNYIVTSTSSYQNCVAKDTIQVVVYNIPVFAGFVNSATNFGNDTTLSCGKSAKLNVRTYITNQDIVNKDPSGEWFSVSSGTSKTIRQVFSINKDTAFIVCESGLIKKSINGGRSWNVVSTNTNATLNSIQFVNDSIAFICGEKGDSSPAVLLKTTNGGNTWDSINTGITGKLTVVWFTDIDTGYIAGGDNVNAKILKTVDGGINWTILNTGNGGMYFNGMYWKNSLTGYIGGYGGNFKKTSDGGNSWQNINTTSSLKFNCINSPDGNTIYAAGVSGNNGFIGKLNSTQTNFVTTIIPNFSIAGEVKSLAFEPDGYGYFCYHDPYDGTWDPFTGGVVARIDATNNVIKWSNTLQHDGSFVTLNRLYGISFNKKGYGYVVGENGYIAKYNTLTYNWQPQTYLSNPYIRNPIASPTQTTNYTVSTINSIGNTQNQWANISVPKLNVTLLSHNVQLNCGDSALIKCVSTSYNGPNPLSYLWTPATGLSNNQLQGPYAKPFSDTWYKVTVSETGGCQFKTDSTLVDVSPMSAPSICMVTFDQQTNKNKIIWTKQANKNKIASYKIYKETTSATQYNLIGTVTGDSLSEFIDYSSYPDQLSARYKLSLTDTCGMETDQGGFHKTMHLTINTGVNGNWNLIWEPYEGFTYPTYKIYRGDNQNNLTYLTSVQSNITTYTDVNPPSGNMYYQILLASSTFCNSTKTTYTGSKSNIVSSANIGINNYGINQSLLIYPTVTSDFITIIQKSEIIKEALVEILDISGRVVFKQKQSDKHLKININFLSKGLYFLRFENEIIQKIIKI